ncbi:MAG: ABC transporter permease [Actinobacteria bacterium]|nr:ABC transporter permease [Actinomycetota bacterium]
MKNSQAKFLDKNKKNRKIKNIDNLIIFAVLIGVVLYFSFKNKSFLDEVNLNALLITLSIIGIVCIGQTLLLISGTFDISLGSIVGFSGVLLAKILELFKINNLSLFILFAFIVVLIGGLIGFINGLIITKGKINAIITTIAMLSIIFALSMIISKGKYIKISNLSFLSLAAQKFGFVPLSFIFLIVLYLIFFIVLKFTVFGRYIYAIGSNENSVNYAGVNVDRIRILLFVLAGALSAFAGIILSSRLTTGHAIFGSSYPIITVAAGVIGGTLLSGGSGGVIGTFLGITLLTVLEGGFSIVGIPTHVKDIFTGTILMVSVIISESLLKRTKR